MSATGEGFRARSQNCQGQGRCCEGDLAKHGFFSFSRLFLFPFDTLPSEEAAALLRIFSVLWARTVIVYGYAVFKGGRATQADRPNSFSHSDLGNRRILD